jgi:hypothetical protein
MKWADGKLERAIGPVDATGETLAHQTMFGPAIRPGSEENNGLLQRDE